MSVLVTHLGLGRGCGRSPDARRARRAPAPPARGRGSTPGSTPWTATGVDWPPCSRAGTRSPSSTADGERYAGQVGIILRNCDTCAAFECSSVIVLRPPMIGRPRTSTPPDATGRRRRSRSEEDDLQRPFEEDAIEEIGIFTPAVLLLFQNGDGTGAGPPLRTMENPNPRVRSTSPLPYGQTPFARRKIFCGARS